MMNKKVLMVTGASSDIGIDLISKIESDYEIVIAHYCSLSEPLEKVRQKIGKKLIMIQADFSNEDSIYNMIKQINSIGYKPDHIVHLAAPKISNTKFHKGDWSSFNNGIEISIHSIVNILQAFIPSMVNKGYGKIIFMLSSVTLNEASKYQSSYTVIKYALLGLMKSLSKEYAEKGIMINGISPDMIDTKFLSDIPDLIVKKNAATSPLGRNLLVQDILPTIQYLLSEGADTVTGQNIGITGGI